MTATPPAHASAKTTVSDAMARLWAKFLPEIERRVAALDAAATALEAGALTPEVRASAHDEAHKLAGSLGTFGLHRGTDIARQAELALAADPFVASAADLAGWVAELRSLIQTRT